MKQEIEEKSNEEANWVTLYLVLGLILGLGSTATLQVVVTGLFFSHFAEWIYAKIEDKETLPYMIVKAICSLCVVLATLLVGVLITLVCLSSLIERITNWMA